MWSASCGVISAIVHACPVHVRGIRRGLVLLLQLFADLLAIIQMAGVLVFALPVVCLPVLLCVLLCAGVVVVRAAVNIAGFAHVYNDSVETYAILLFAYLSLLVVLLLLLLTMPIEPVTTKANPHFGPSGLEDRADVDG